MAEQRGGMASRREVLKLGGLAGGLAAAGPLLAATGAAAAQRPAGPRPAPAGPSGGLPVAEIEHIIRAKGTVSDGVLNIEIDREDIPHVHKEGVPIKPAFEINGNLCFQAAGDGSSRADGEVMFNGDLCFKAGELNPAIDKMIEHGLVWQAEHQHLFGLDPMVWFMHMRGRGSGRKLAEACAAVLSVTSTPLPQAPPKHPTTPLDASRLGKIIGAAPSVGAAGVVSIDVPRRDRIELGGVDISPFLNVYTPVAFQPVGGSKAVVVPDFGMTAAEVTPVTRLMRHQGWQVNCLYNQETDEDPQLYFSHQFKVGDAYQLAKEVRSGLDLMNVKLT